MATPFCFVTKCTALGDGLHVVLKIHIPEEFSCWSDVVRKTGDSLQTTCTAGWSRLTKSHAVSLKACLN